MNTKRGRPRTITVTPYGWWRAARQRLIAHLGNTQTAQSYRFFDELFRLSRAIQKDPIDAHRMICAYYGTDGVDVERLEYLRHVAERGEALPWEAQR